MAAQIQALPPAGLHRRVGSVGLQVGWLDGTEWEYGDPQVRPQI